MNDFVRNFTTSHQNQAAEVCEISTLWRCISRLLLRWGFAGKLLSGAAAGGIGQFIASPTDLVKVRLQTDRGGQLYRGVWPVHCLCAGLKWNTRNYVVSGGVNLPPPPCWQGVPWKPFPFSKGISLLDIHLEGFSPCLVYRWLDPPHPTWQWSTTPCDFFSDRKCCQAAAMTCGGHCLQVIYAEGGSRAFFYGVMYLQPSVPKHNRPLFARDEY